VDTPVWRVVCIARRRNYRDTCQNWTMNKTESCINRTLINSQCKKSLLKLTYIKRTHVYSEPNSWSKWILFRQGPHYVLFQHHEALSTVLWFSCYQHIGQVYNTWRSHTQNSH
jgi:hypothetical protein